MAVAVGGCAGNGADRGTTRLASAGNPGLTGAPSQSPPAPPPATATPPAKPPAGHPRGAADVRHVFPIAGPADYGHTHHDYPATDIFANCGTPVRAVTDGVVLEVERVDRFTLANPLGADKGGLSVSVRGDDGVRYYGSHLSAIAPGVDAGTRVAPGTTIGFVGQSGNASHVCHLHFGISPLCQATGDWWIRRGVVYPWRYLDAWKAGTNLYPTDEIAGWQAAHGCPATPPSNER
jgi:peptidoglycan LD-endopeptidase LytH